MVGEGQAAGADGCLCGLWLGVPSSPLTILVSILWGVWGSLGFPVFSLLTLEFITLAPFYVAFVLVVTTFATKIAGGGTPEVIVMVSSFSIFSVLLSFLLQHAPIAMIAVSGMTRPPLVIDRFTVEEWGYTCVGFHLIHGT